MLNRHVFIYLFGHGVPAFIGFVGLIIYAHIVTPAEYGIYVVGQGVAGVGSMAFFGWIRLAVSRYQAEDETVDLRAVVLLVYGVSSLLLLATSGLVMLVAGAQFDHVTASAIVMMALCLGIFEINQDLRRATFKPLAFTMVAVSRGLLTLVLGVAVIEAGWGGTGLLLAASFSLFVTGIAFSWPTWRRGLNLDELHLARRFVRYGVPLAVSGIVFAIYAALDRLAVAYLIGQEAAGRYGVASDLARQMIGVIAASVGAAISPIAFRTMTAGKDATLDHLGKSLELLLALVAPVAIWLATCADVLAGAVLGPEYVATVALLLPMLALARLFGALTNFYVHISYQLAERPMLQLSNDALILVLYLLLMVPLTLAFGLEGAAAAALGSELLGFSFGLLLARRGFQLPFAPSRLSRVATALAILASSIYLTKSAIGGPDWVRLAAATIAGVVAYGIAVIAFDIGEIRPVLATRWVGLMAALRAEPNA